MDNKNAYLANPAKEEDLVYRNTCYGESVAHINIGTEDNPFYVPQDMFKITDSQREYLIKWLKVK